jgi:hypothetical protein
MRGKADQKLGRSYVARRSAAPAAIAPRPIIPSSTSWNPVNGSAAGPASSAEPPAAVSTSVAPPPSSAAAVSPPWVPLRRAGVDDLVHNRDLAGRDDRQSQ